MAIVGIDLGTTNSLVAHMEGDRPQIIPNRSGRRLTPSVVGLDRAGTLHVGETAKNQLVSMPERTVAEVKRLMGTAEKVRLGDRTYAPQEISALILRSLKEDAEKQLGTAVEEAVITVPAYFTDAQRQATKDAGELAGFKVERILNEPTAAALAYGVDHLDREQFVLVYDLGGGTFDVSVLEMFEGVLDVKASAGNNRLGGSDFDRAVVEWMAAEIDREHKVNVRGDLRAMARLKAAAEQAKMELSTVTVTQVMLPFLAMRSGEPLSVELELSRLKLEELLGDLVRSTLQPVERALKDAKLDRKAITDVVLVGGSSRVPLVQRIMEEHFGKAPRGGVNPDEAIALGAAIQAGLKSGAIRSQNGIMITDVCPFTLGVEVMGRSGGGERVSGLFSPIIPRNSTVPISRTESYSTTRDGQRQVDIRVYQGEDRLVRNNTFLDAYSVDGVPAASAGAEHVAVTFTYDVNGILNVRTKVASTGKEATLVVDKSAQRMSPKERQEARARLEREWGPGAPGAPAPRAEAAAAPEPPLPDGVRDLVAAAQAKLTSLAGKDRARVEELVDRLQDASRRGDAAQVSRLDGELTEVLFDLG
ncbi:MAG TPA: Hsp70 family protein [Myxococcales bacterium]|nr:Hsp70 family protein [Myxococcales bacterium]